MHRTTEALGLAGLAAGFALCGVMLGLMMAPQRMASDVVTGCTYRAHGALPDRRCTPGAINHAVTQKTIRTTICVRGWTATVRPPLSYTAPLKHVLLAAYGQPQQPQRYELDHLIPLELGGAAYDTRNLWPEPDASPNAKDAVENRLRRRVCAGSMTLAAARRIVRTDWRTAP